MALTYYDRHGAAVAYLDDDDTHIYAYDGRPLAYLDGEHLWSFGGEFLGWNRNGWLWDKSGSTMLSTAASQGGPMKPFEQFEPFKGFKQFLPFKGFKEFVPFEPFFTTTWSDDQFWH
jgi:hypothetical protein